MKASADRYWFVLRWERLRDLVAAGGIDRLYVPVSRSAGTQLCSPGVAGRRVPPGRRSSWSSSTHAHDPTPEGNLLLQVQGVIAEYERAKIQERNRRGKLHAARSGSMSVFGASPLRLPLHRPQGRRRGRPHRDRRGSSRGGPSDFHLGGRGWILALRDEASPGNPRVANPSGGTRWLTSTLGSMLANPAYAGTAMFGRTRFGPRRETLRRPPTVEGWTCPQPFLDLSDRRLRADRDRGAGDHRAGGVRGDAGQAGENRKRKRVGVVGTTCLLQGLLVCSKCGYAYVGAYSNPKTKPNPYRYYRCDGGFASRFGGVAICNNKLLNRGPDRRGGLGGTSGACC